MSKLQRSCRDWSRSSEMVGARMGSRDCFASRPSLQLASEPTGRLTLRLIGLPSTTRISQNWGIVQNVAQRAQNPIACEVSLNLSVLFSSPPPAKYLPSLNIFPPLPSQPQKEYFLSLNIFFLFLLLCDEIFSFAKYFPPFPSSFFALS